MTDRTIRPGDPGGERPVQPFPPTDEARPAEDRLPLVPDGSDRDAVVAWFSGHMDGSSATRRATAILDTLLDDAYNRGLAASRPAPDTRTEALFEDIDALVEEFPFDYRVVEISHKVDAIRRSALPRVQTRKDRAMTDDARPSEDRPEPFTSRDIDYWRQQLADRLPVEGGWSDADVMTVVGRFVATLDALAASRPAPDTRTEHECGVCARVNEAPHCPGCGRCLAASRPAPETRTSLRNLLMTPCVCEEAWTARNRHAPDCNWQFIHDFLSDEDIATVLAFADASTS